MRLEPSWRQAAGIGLILLLIALWSFAVASLAGIVTGWPLVAQVPFYVVAGLAWIIPLRPLLRWMETGKWRD